MHKNGVYDFMSECITLDELGKCGNLVLWEMEIHDTLRGGQDKETGCVC